MEWDEEIYAGAERERERAKDLELAGGLESWWSIL